MGQGDVAHPLERALGHPPRRSQLPEDTPMHPASRADSRMAHIPERPLDPAGEGRRQRFDAMSQELPHDESNPLAEGDPNGPVSDQSLGPEEACRASYGRNRKRGGQSRAKGAVQTPAARSASGSKAHVVPTGHIMRNRTYSST